MNLLRAMTMSATATMMGACAAQPNMMPTPAFAPVRPAPAAPETQATGAVSNSGMASFRDMRSSQGGDLKVGDRVIVLLSEITQASRSSDISTSRAVANSRAAANNVVTEAKIGRGRVISEGTGTAGQAASLAGSISATVVEVLSNDNLVILGEKQLAVTEGSEFIRLKGTVRRADIQPDNTVLSRLIANAQISYLGTRDLAKASEPGWGTGLMSKFWPF
jgi:flagellar L-ring protein precursor FlgH